jgi:hypothetical protein
MYHYFKSEADNGGPLYKVVKYEEQTVEENHGGRKTV